MEGDACISKPELLALETISKDEGLMMSDIGRRLDITFSTATGIIDRLIEKKLMKRERKHGDRRVVRVLLTDKGRKSNEAYQDQKKEIFGMILGGLDKFVKPGNKLLLKVNAIIGFLPDRAATTHPAVVMAVSELVKEAGGIPMVGDSSEAFGFTGQSLEMCGIAKAAKEAGAELVNFESTGRYQDTWAADRECEDVSTSMIILRILG